MTISCQTYLERCRQRWSGPALQDAVRNWSAWQERHQDLLEAMRQFRHNPTLEDLSGQCHHDGTLTGYLWKLQEAWQPDRSCLDPLLDFEEHYQRVFLRRGLVIYCQLLLDSLKPEKPEEPGQLVMALDSPAPSFEVPCRADQQPASSDSVSSVSRQL